MTIKRRLFFSNIRMVLVLVGFLLAAVLTSHLLMAAIFRVRGFNEFSDIETYRKLSRSIQLISFAAFAVLIVIINSIITNRMIKKITVPLDILTNGVSMIRKNDFSCRIEYGNDDEFRPVCEAFNQMAAQLEASTAQRLKDEANRRELLAGISHDLRTPLTTISGYLDGLESGVASTPQMREKYFSTIKNNTAGMKHIIEQLFLFSKLDMDEFPFSPHRFDIMRALSDMAEELTEEYAMRGLIIAVAESPQNVFVYADVSQLRRVVINILENSARYKEKETGHLEISASLPDANLFGDATLDNNFVQIMFSDDGPGVNPDALINLFNVFYRTDPSRHTKGSGLGLAISAKIIERSGGSIYAENGDHGGLTIVIRLPIKTGAV